LSSVHVGGVCFRIYPRDHAPIHARGRYAGTAAIVVLIGDGAVELARRADAVLPPDAKRSDVRRILDAAERGYDEIVAAWEQMQG
jgi:hypothetical protein